MARGRMISKTISLDEKVNALSNDTVRLLFTWLIPHLDCEGRMYGDPQTVKSIVFPRRSMDVRTLRRYLDELVKSGLIRRYVNGDSTFIDFPNFPKHQLGLRKSQESASQIPPFTTELKRGESVLAPTQIKTKVETKTKEESVMDKITINKESVLDVYKKEIAGLREEESLNEAVEGDIEDAIRRFTAPWVIDAIQEAVKRNRREWPYTVGILKNWKRYGKDEHRRSIKKIDPDKYIKGKFGHMVRR